MWLVIESDLVWFSSGPPWWWGGYVDGNHSKSFVSMVWWVIIIFCRSAWVNKRLERKIVKCVGGHTLFMFRIQTGCHRSRSQLVWVVGCGDNAIIEGEKGGINWRGQQWFIDYFAKRDRLNCIVIQIHSFIAIFCLIWINGRWRYWDNVDRNAIVIMNDYN